MTVGVSPVVKIFLSHNGGIYFKIDTMFAEKGGAQEGREEIFTQSHGSIYKELGPAT